MHFEVFEHIAFARVFIYIFLSTFVLGNLAYWLRTRHGWRDGYGRKLNHFGQVAISLPTLAVLEGKALTYSSICASLLLLVVYSVSAVSRRKYVRGIVASFVRERDGEHGLFFVFLPFISTNIALYSALAVFPVELVRIAWATVGIADGLAEPVGLRWGTRHGYSTYDPVFRQYNTKSLQGSCAVGLAATAICYTGLTLMGQQSVLFIALASGLYGAIITCIEAYSPRGMDNSTILFGGALMLQLAS
jgi:dolichol kinase